jgi:hypothetical protein
MCLELWPWEICPNVLSHILAESYPFTLLSTTSAIFIHGSSHNWMHSHVSRRIPVAFPGSAEGRPSLATNWRVKGTLCWVRFQHELPPLTANTSCKEFTDTQTQVTFSSELASQTLQTEVHRVYRKQFLSGTSHSQISRLLITNHTHHSFWGLVATTPNRICLMTIIEINHAVSKLN